MPLGGWLPGWWCKRDTVGRAPEEAAILRAARAECALSRVLPGEAPEGQFYRCAQGWIYTAKSPFEDEEVNDDIEPEDQCLFSNEFSMRSSCSRQRPAANRSRTRPDWTNRHHNVVSKINLGSPPTRRAYFDPLPQVRVLNGEYKEMPVYQPQELDDLGEHHLRLRHRQVQHPLQLKPSIVQIPLPAATDLSQSDTDVAEEQAPPSSVVHFPPPPMEALLDIVQLMIAARPAVDLLDGSISLTASTVDTMNLSGTAGSASGGDTLSELQNDVKSPSGKRASRRASKTKESSKKQHVKAQAHSSEFMRFAEWAETKHKNIVHTWHKLDRDASMHLSKMEFLKGLKELQYPYDSGKLWLNLDRDHTGTVSFIEFAPESACELARLKHWLQIKYGTAQASVASLDKDRNGKLLFPEFVSSMKREGFPAKWKSSLPTLFFFLGRANEIQTRDLVFLDNWKCPAYLWDEPDPEARQLFQEALVSRHGENHLIAWRKTLDRDSSMRVNYDEFHSACKRLAREGIEECNPAKGVPALYLAYDRDHSGWFSLRDFDANSYRLLLVFTLWAKEQFHKVSLCVKAWEKEEGKGIGLNAFRHGIHDLGLSSEEVEYLFEGLSLESIAYSKAAGAFKVGKIMQAELAFLDKWKPEEEASEEKYWEMQRGSKLRKSRFVPSPLLEDLASTI